MKKHPKPTPEQMLKGNEQVLEFLARYGLPFLGLFLLILGWTYGLQIQDENRLSPWHAGFASGTWFGLFMAALIVLMCDLLVLGLRRKSSAP